MSQSSVKTRKMTAGKAENKGNTSPNKNQILLSKYLLKQSPETFETKKPYNNKSKTTPTPATRDKKKVGDKANVNRYEPLSTDIIECEQDRESESSDEDQDLKETEPIYVTLSDIDVEGLDEIDISSLDIDITTIPIILRAMLLKIEKLEVAHDMVTRDNDTLKESLDFAHNKIVDLEKRELEREAEINNTKSKVECVESSNMMIKVDSQRMKERSIKSEAYSRRMNLRFEGVDQGANESQNQCRNKIYSILSKEMGIENAERNITIDRCHRDNKFRNQNPQSILVKFLSTNDRDLVWKNRHTLNRNRDNKIFLNEGFPPEVEKRRAFLRPYVKAAWASNKRATLVGDTLLVEGLKYTADTLDQLPPDIQPEKVVIKTNNETTLFYRQDAFLSNFHPSVFTIEGRTYNCNEQYYCAQKARCFGDRPKECQIMASNNPAEMKYLSSDIKGYNNDFWMRKREQVMHQGLMAKFTQNERLAKKLDNTGNNLLAESAPNDTFWGTGVHMMDKNAFVQKAWNGKNTLGNLLMQVRDSIRN